MRIVIVANPRSGRGKALGLAAQLAMLLGERGHTVDRPELNPDLRLDEAAQGADRLVIVGGDGTIHHSAAAAARSGVAVYHLATGTENLFARSFRMPRKPTEAAAELEKDYPPLAIDLGSANGVPFTLMCSVGVDASVIHRVEAVRGAKGGHIAYIRPSVSEGLRPRPARVRVAIDGAERRADFRGTLVVSNLPAYALRMDPCAGADPSDGRLDVAFLPSTSSVGTAMDFLRCKLRSRAIRRERAEAVEVTGIGPESFVQIDGERPRNEGGLHPVLVAGGVIRLGVWPEKLRVHGRFWG